MSAAARDKLFKLVEIAAENHGKIIQGDEKIEGKISIEVNVRELFQWFVRELVVAVRDCKTLIISDDCHAILACVASTESIIAKYVAGVISKYKYDNDCEIEEYIVCVIESMAGGEDILNPQVLQALTAATILFAKRWGHAIASMNYPTFGKITLQKMLSAARIMDYEDVSPTLFTNAYKAIVAIKSASRKKKAA